MLAAGYSVIKLMPAGYVTDVLAYSHESVELVLDGENPYAVNDPDEVDRVNLELIAIPLIGATTTSDGEPIARLMNYPAGHFLVFIPSFLLGVDDVRWTTMAAGLGTVALLWLVATPVLRPIIALPVLVNAAFADSFPVGISDHLWLLPLMGMVIAVYSGKPLAGAVLFGIAAATKQQPWFLAPFLTTWLWRRSSAPTRARAIAVARFGAVAAAVFLVFNLPFILWSPTDWTESILYPMTADLALTGSGLSALSFRGVVDLDKSVFLVASVLAVVLLMSTYWVYFDRLAHAVWVFPAIILWFNYRSNDYYFSFWPPLLLLGVLLAWKHGELLHPGREPLLQVKKGGDGT